MAGTSFLSLLDTLTGGIGYNGRDATNVSNQNGSRFLSQTAGKDGKVRANFAVPDNSPETQMAASVFGRLGYNMGPMFGQRVASLDGTLKDGQYTFNVGGKTRSIGEEALRNARGQQLAELLGTKDFMDMAISNGQQNQEATKPKLTGPTQAAPAAQTVTNPKTPQQAGPSVTTGPQVNTPTQITPALPQMPLPEIASMSPVIQQQIADQEAKKKKGAPNDATQPQQSPLAQQQMNPYMQPFMQPGVPWMPMQTMMPPGMMGGMPMMPNMMQMPFGNFGGPMGGAAPEGNSNG